MKLNYDQRQEVNRLMEAAQDDLESVLFELVGQRDAAVEALRNVMFNLGDNWIIISEKNRKAADAALAKIGGK